MRWLYPGGLSLAVLVGCVDAPTTAESNTETWATDDRDSGDGDGDAGDGDGDGESGDGDGDGEPGDGDGDGDGDGEPGCNGHVELCERAYDKVVFAGTHNAHAASDEGFSQFNANQPHGIPQQLEDGIRVMLLDTYYDEANPDSIVLCHGPCGLGSTPHVEVLGAIVEFLTNNPGEVLTLIYEDHVAPEDLALDYDQTGAIELVYVHEPGQPWPTLGEMVAANTRLVVTAEQGSPPPAWHHKQ